ncbi:hypothetical protein ACFXK0_07900 [Nocardia sp. NPDC059177]|uniref:hypothetical protein n=1 Tax=Nocardia sp. NPDC059177 TaxID=3346759 RepID=UPI00369861D1
MARYEQWDDDPEEDVDDRRWNGQRWPQVSTDDGHGRQSELPRVNPYAMVALAAALVLLFPIAIVFGLLSFGHPRGRGIAVLALLLGVTEVAAAAAIGLTVFGGFEMSLPNLAQNTSATVTTTPVAVVSAHGTPSATGAVPVVSSTPGTPTVVEKSTPCTVEQAGLLGVTADGATLLCLRAGGAYTWSGPHRVSGSHYTEGAPCDPSIDKSGRTSDNYALVCETIGGTSGWVLWTE